MFTRSALAAVTVAVLFSLSTSLAYAAGTIDITDPADGATLPGKSATVRGTVSDTGSAAGQRTVTYLLDVSSSTGTPTGMDCNGDGAVNAGDNFNGDSRTGDVLDCEIAAVQSLNGSLSATAGLQVGVAAFGNQGRYAEMGSGRFFAPSATDSSGRNRVRVVTNSITQGRIGQYAARIGLGTGTSFNNALDAVIPAYASVSGEKWVFMISDGESTVSPATLTKLKDAGIKVRTFAVGNSAACGPTTDLTQIATTTGENCVHVTDPTDLSAAFSGASTAVDAVTVTVSGPEGYAQTVDVTSSVNALGDWTTGELSDLATGDYTATSTARFTDGSSTTDTVTFTVPGVQPEPTATPTPSTGPIPSTTPTPSPTVTPWSSATPSPSTSTARPSAHHSHGTEHSHSPGAGHGRGLANTGA